MTPVDQAAALQLTYISDEEDGWTRRRCGRGFIYCRADGTRIAEAAIIERLRCIGIPPAWEEVWICPEPDGHLLATGRDEKGRKQYIYHPDWMAYNQATKFQKMIRFAEQLPHIRRQLAQDLRRRQWDRARVLALAVSILDECGMRIGNQQYADANGTYGLTTLRRKHVEVTRDGIHFSYKGKSGQYREVDVADRKLARLVKDLADMRGYELFRYRDADGKFHNIESHDVNEYIRAIAGEEFSSKDFRTWAATTAAVEFYEQARADLAENPRLKMETALVRRVAKHLGNTLSVCRKYYIHPLILEAAVEGRIPPLDSIRERDLEKFAGELDVSEVIAYQLMQAAAAEQPEVSP